MRDSKSNHAELKSSQALKKYFAVNKSDRGTQEYYRAIVRHLSEFFKMLSNLPELKNKFEKGNQDNSKTKILEIGCRSAITVFAMEDFFTNFDYLCIEIDSYGVDFLQKNFRHNPRLTFIAADASNPEALEQKMLLANMSHPDFVLIRHPLIYAPHWFRFIPVIGVPGTQSRSFWKILTGPGARYFNNATLITTNYFKPEFQRTRHALCHASANCDDMVGGAFASSVTKGDPSPDDAYYNAISNYTYKEPTHIAASEVLNSDITSFLLLGLVLYCGRKYGSSTTASVVTMIVLLIRFLPTVCATETTTPQSYDAVDVVSDIAKALIDFPWQSLLLLLQIPALSFAKRWNPPLVSAKELKISQSDSTVWTKQPNRLPPEERGYAITSTI